MARFLVAALYKFVALPDYQALQAPLQAVCDQIVGKALGPPRPADVLALKVFDLPVEKGSCAQLNCLGGI